MAMKMITQLIMWRVLMVTLSLQVGALAADYLPAESAAIQVLAGCKPKCGDVEIPYPFGIDDPKCFLEEKFKLNCTDSKLYIGNVQVSNIDTLKSQMDVPFYVSETCGTTETNVPSFYSSLLSISSEENKFVTVGRDSYGYFKIYDYDDDNRWLYFKNTVPVVLDWTIGTKSCNDVSKTICRNNSYCYDNDTIPGYRCRCKMGYEGNPYYPRGCTDINECTTSTHICESAKNCINTPWSYTCFCPKGQSGNGTREGRCQPRNGNGTLTTILGVGVGAAIIVLFVGALSYLIYEKRKLNKLKEKFFHQNGGTLLQQKLDQRKDSSQVAQIFTEDQLKKATNNFDDALIVGRGGFGTVFKGCLADNRIVAIKKSKIIDESQIEQFINEVDVVSQINHRNVVKLLGCCLETEVPLLVYEFVNNGTLSDFINKEGNANIATWKTRLKIATEVAGALSYLHSAASIPIIHRDVKSANILLGDTYTAKVSDFGASRLVPLDQTEVATMVQGTIGYLDPEYMQTSQLNEKSDVYSFGVVLVELITGKTPFCFSRSEHERSLSMHFLSCLRNDCVSEVLQDGLLNEENEKEVMEVAILASRCLRLKGEERPKMKEVAMELEGMRLMEKHSWSNSGKNLEETQYLLCQGSTSIYMSGDSSIHGFTGYDNLKDQVSIDLDDGR